jgi:trigger factor
MLVRIEDVSPVEKKLVVEVPWTTVNDRLLEAYRELGKTVQIKGFRKGKVPRSVLEKMFGSRVSAEVIVQLVRESFLTATSKHKLEAVSEPILQDDPKIIKGEPLAFEAVVEVRGDVEANDYRGMELKKRRVHITDEAVEQALTQLQREHTELRPIEGRDKLAASDYVALAVKGRVGDREIHRPQLAVDLGSPDEEPLPGLVAALIGLPLGSGDHSVSLQIPADHSNPELAGKTAELTVSVLEARQKDVPAIDDELAKDTGEADSLEQLRVLLRKRLEERMGEEAQSELRDAARRELVKRNQIPIASRLSERAALYKEQRFRAMLGLQDQNDVINDELRAKLREGVDDDIRGQLLIEAVARKEELAITDAEVEERVAQMAQRQGSAPARLRAEMERDDRLDNLRYQLLHNKVLDFIIQRSVVTEVDGAELEGAHVHDENCQHDSDGGHDDRGHVHGQGCDHQNEEARSLAPGKGGVSQKHKSASADVSGQSDSGGNQ